ncbi:unnamed protein product [Ilex paraguariensis]|uniref:Uncharacterized protein n=1 Tax=Ilex paraguariensis TaxID=185542 RepID=A0ABC8TDU0_9AQUA
MANHLLRGLRKRSVFSLLKSSSSNCLCLRSILHNTQPIFTLSRPIFPLKPSNSWWVFRNFSHGSVNFVISQGKPKFETHEIEPPKKEKWKTKKRLKLQRKKEKQRRKAANKRDPRRIGVKGRKKRQRFANAEERIKYKLEKVSKIGSFPRYKCIFWVKWFYVFP